MSWFYRKNKKMTPYKHVFICLLFEWQIFHRWKYLSRKWKFFAKLSTLWHAKVGIDFITCLVHYAAKSIRYGWQSKFEDASCRSCRECLFSKNSEYLKNAGCKQRKTKWVGINPISGSLKRKETDFRSPFYPSLFCSSIIGLQRTYLSDGHH